MIPISFVDNFYFFSPAASSHVSVHEPISPLWDKNTCKDPLDDSRATQFSEQPLFLDEVEEISRLVPFPCEPKFLKAKRPNLRKLRATNKKLNLELATQRQIEAELCLKLNTSTEPKPAPRVQAKPFRRLAELRKPPAEKRFSARFTKDARLRNKVRRAKLYWTGRSEAIPNVFRVATGDGELEFLDFSRKNVLPDLQEGLSF